jgi:copper(I)-binding protein
MRLLLALLLLAPLAAMAQIEIENAWSRATAPGAKVAAGYMLIRNKSGSPDRLVGASSPAAARVETHVHLKEGNIMRMREVKGYDIPARGSFELKPGGAHLMFVDIKQPFKEGERIPAVLTFEKSGEVRVEFHVGRLTAPPPAHGAKH